MKKHLLKFLVSLSFVLLFFCFNSKTVFAAEISQDNKWEYEVKSDNTVKLTDYLGAESASINIPETIVGSDGVSYTVTELYKTFVDDDWLESAQIPSTVTVLYSTFFNCTKLQNVTLPDSIVEIGGWSFNTTRISSAYLPNVTFIGPCAFSYSCLTSIYAPKLTSLGTGAFTFTYITDVDFPLLTEIDEGTFYYCSDLKTVKLVNVEEVGMSAFDGCNNLSSLYLPKVSYIAGEVFYECPDNFKIYGNEYVQQYKKEYYSDSNIEVILSVSDIALNKTSFSMKVGDTDSLTATVSPENASNKSVIWSSSDSNVVSVDNGNIVAKAEGTAIITVTANDGSGKKATCSITVTNDNNPNPGPNPGPNPDPDPNPNPGPNPDPNPEKPDGNENASVKMNNMLTFLIKNAAGKNEKTVIYFKDYTGNDAISIDVFNLLAENPNVVLVLDYTFFDEDTQKDIHVHAVINQAILSKIVTSDNKLFGPACLSGFVQYYNDLPAEIKNQNY